MTALSASYAIGVLLALVAFGGLSDRIGRRPLLLLGSSLVLSSNVIVLIAPGPVELFGARVVLGIASGVLSAAAAAALVELEPDHDARRAATWTTLALLGGTATGPLASGLVAQFTGASTTISALGQLPLDALLVVLVSRVPLSGARPTPLRRGLAVPREILGRFTLAGLAVSAGWMMGGIYAALATSIERELLSLDSHVAAGAVLFGFAAIGGLAQLAARHVSARHAMAIGLGSAACGMALLVLAVLQHTIWLFLVATLACGAGNGLCFVGSLSLVNEIAPADRRAELVAAWSLVMYLTLVVPVVGLGLLADHVGLERATAIYGAALVVLCVAAATGLALERRAIEAQRAP